MLTAAAALVLVLTVLGHDRPRLVSLIGIPVLILLFKVGGLYDREQVRLLRSTLDEAPVILQLAGLYALSVTILRPLVVDGHLGSAQIAGLWMVTFVAIVGGRMVARWLAGRMSAIERCLVIGDPDRALRIRDKLGSSGARAVVAATLPLEANEVDQLDGPGGVRRLVDDLNVDRIIVAPGSSEADITELIRLA